MELLRSTKSSRESNTYDIESVKTGPCLVRGPVTLRFEKNPVMIIAVLVFPKTTARFPMNYLGTIDIEEEEEKEKEDDGFIQLKLIQPVNTDNKSENETSENHETSLYYNAQRIYGADNVELAQMTGNENSKLLNSQTTDSSDAI